MDRTLQKGRTAEAPLFWKRSKLPPPEFVHWTL